MMKPAERDYQRNASSQTQVKSTTKNAPAANSVGVSYLPLNGLSDVTFVTGYEANATLPCHTADPDLFFSEESGEIEVAKALCGGCPVARQCLEGALSRAEPCGVWGGQLFDNGRVVAAKRRAGRPRIHTQDESQKIVALAGTESLLASAMASATGESDRLSQGANESFEAAQLERAS